MRLAHRSLLSGALGAVILLAPPLGAQDQGAARLALVGGASLTNEPSGPQTGVHVGLALLMPRSPRLGFRAEAMAQMLPASDAIPSCIPSAPCEETTIVPGQLHAAIASIELRPFASFTRLTLLAGAGGYVSREANGGWTGRAGVSAGGGLGITPSGRVRVELRYHHLADRIGVLRGVVLPSLLVRF